jgi:mRNA deadenylase 3'-5' endonuclease subunit Ccr4
LHRFVLEAHYEVDLESAEYGVSTDWPQCAQIASLRLVQTLSKRIIVANTHLKANETVVDERIRNAQAAILLDQIKNFIITYRLGQPPILICGDFNSRPSSTVYKLFVQGSTQAEVGYQPNNFKHLTHPFRLSSAYRSLHTLRSIAAGIPADSVSSAERPSEAPFTMRMPGWVVTYDYIFYSQDWLRVVQLLDIPDEQTWPEKCLPAWNFGSDHLSLVAWFDWLQDCIYN